jgi:hypothetical protein
VPQHPSLTTAAHPLTRFRSARISFAFAWTEQYDQGGLLLSFRQRSAAPRPASSSGGTSTATNTATDATKTAGPEDPPAPDKWIKSGVEFYNGAPMVGTVACDRWADWSLAPLPLPLPLPGGAGPDKREGGGEGEGEGEGERADGQQRRWVTVQIERARDQHGTSLWVYLVGEEGAKTPLREVCWVYGDGAAAGREAGSAESAEWELVVSGYAARPEKSSREGLEVQFRGFEVKWD